MPNDPALPIAIEPTLSLSPSDPSLAEKMDRIAPSYGVYAFRLNDVISHLGWSSNLRKRITRLLGSHRAPSALRDRMAGRNAEVLCWETGSYLETLLCSYGVSRVHFPDYQARLKLRNPAFLQLTSDNFPRLALSHRPQTQDGSSIGPFRTRELAERYSQSVESLFQIRRCSEILAPSLEHPGCIYGEMKLCLRPCQLAVSQDEYTHEARRVQTFLRDTRDSATAALRVSRSAAAQDLDFELAQAIHHRIESIEKSFAARPDAVRPLAGFAGIAMNRAPDGKAVVFRPMQGARWQQPFLFSPSSDNRVSLDAQLREACGLTSRPVEGEITDHLALFLRWYEPLSRKDDASGGSWFFANAAGELPFRRLSRAVSKLISGAPVSAGR